MPNEPPSVEPPFDVELEQALLGALLIDNGALAATATFLKPEHFYDPLHQRLYEASFELWSHGRPATPITVAAVMAGDEGFADVGAKDYLVSLARGAPAAARPREWSRILGDLATRRSIIAIAQNMTQAAEYPTPGRTPSDVADAAGEALYEATRLGSDKEPVVVFDAVREAMSFIEEVHLKPHQAVISLGLPPLDRALGGLFPGDLHALGAAPSMGKSGAACQIARTAASEGRIVAVFSLEMTRRELAIRYIAQESKVPSDRLIIGNVTDKELAKVAAAEEKFYEIPLFIDDTSRLSVPQIRARAMGIRRRNKGLSLIIIDHLLYVRATEYRAPLVERVQQITTDLKAVAKDLDVPVLLICHLNREYMSRANHRPQNSDLYGGAAIEQNADHIWFLHREEFYLAREAPNENDKRAYEEWCNKKAKAADKAEFFSTKRRMGKVGSCTIGFDEKLVRFFDPDDNVNQDVLGLIA